MAFDAKTYPPDWLARRRFIVDYRARGRCEWCGAVNYEPHPDTGSQVVLTIAHVWDKRHMSAGLLNLAALCQRCHLRHDRADHNLKRLRNRIVRLLQAGQLPLPWPPRESFPAQVFEELLRSGELLTAMAYQLEIPRQELMKLVG